MPRFIIESGPSRGAIIPLPVRKSVRIGRDSGCTVRLQDEKVSRRHSALEWEDRGFGHGGFEDGGFVLCDMKSRNGTFVNGRRVDRHALHGGEMIRVGSTYLSFAVEDEDPLLGKDFCGYRILERVGQGAMGTVYRAVQLSLERDVALKVLSPALFEEGEFVERFLAEARAAGHLSHPNIVQVFDVGQQNRNYFISMEYLPGGSLQSLIERDGPLAAEDALSFALDAAGALVWAGEKGIVHRDIKPDNLLVTDRPSAKVADFGLAADRRRSKSLFDGGKVIGTPSYMAPEQALGKPIDHRADIYALGSTLYALLAGVPPYDGESPVEILVRKTKEPPPPLARRVRAAQRDLPREAVDVVEKMMERDPRDRYQSAREVEEALRWALDAAKARETRSDARQGGFTSRIARDIRGTFSRWTSARKRPGGS